MTRIQITIFNIYCLILMPLLNVTHTYNLDIRYPITFVSSAQTTRNSGSHFGFSVGLIKRGDDISRILIGAPKSNSSIYKPVTETGALHLCTLKTIPNTPTTVLCDEIDIFQKRVRISSSPMLKDQMTKNMFLGSSIQIQPNSDVAVTCAHSWTNEIYLAYPNRPIYHVLNPTGACYLFNVRENAQRLQKLFPMTDYNKQTKYDTYYYSHSMAGFSAIFTEDGQNLVLGAPGFFQWRGTVVSYPITGPFTPGDEIIQNNVKIQTEIYMGYSIASGKFYRVNEYQIAAGAPRDANHTGSVYVFKLPKKGLNRPVYQANRITGNQFGEYFGSAVLSVDINGDKISDLVVGAPFYSNSIKQIGDRGRVYVYIANGNGFNEPKILTGNGSPGARFGSSLANLNDINNDNYGDIVVGAPYEDDQGAIYIYLGSKGGFRTKFQRISAKEHFPSLNLRGFGISFSNGVDIDDNKYPDLVIGSYLSEKAVLLRSRPIAVIKPTLLMSMDQINMGEPTCVDNQGKKVVCFTITPCFSYSGKFVPQRQNLSMQLDMDSQLTKLGFTNLRSYIQLNNDNYTTIQRYMTIELNRRNCFRSMTTFLKSNFEDKLTPMEFTLNYNLVQPSRDEFCANCPIITSSDSKIESIHFETGCQSRRCLSNLTLDASLISFGEDIKSVILGYHQEMKLNLKLNNFGEHAYLTKLNLIMKPGLKFSKLDSRCKILDSNDATQSALTCDGENPLESGLSTFISVGFDLTTLETSDKEMNIQIELTSASDLTADTQRNITLVVPIKRYASIEIIGNSMSAQYMFEDGKIRKNDNSYFSALFQVVKDNHSPVNTIDISLQIPTSVPDGTSFLYSPLIEVKGTTSINCNQSLSDLPSYPQRVRNELDNLMTEFDSSELLTKRQRRSSASEVFESLRPSAVTQISLDKIVTLDCNSTTCTTLRCQAGPFGNGRRRALFQFKSAINISVIENHFGTNHSTILLNIGTEAEIINKLMFENQDFLSHSSQLGIIFKRLPYHEKLNLWILIISISVGVLLFTIILIALIKFGFFRRNKRQEIRDLMEAEAMKKNWGSNLDLDLSDTSTYADDSSSYGVIQIGKV